jgi:hypothetical protein
MNLKSLHYKGKHCQPSLLFLFVCHLVLTLCVGPVSAQSSGFWVWNGTSLTRVYDNNTSQFVVREWQVWLYNMGKPTGGKDYWGMLTGRTSEEVMQRLKQDQGFELRSNNFFGKGRVPSQTLGNFNPLGPIAIVERPAPKATPTPRPAAGATPRPAPAPRPEARWGDPYFHLGQDFLDDDLRRKRDAVRKAWGDFVSAKDALTPHTNIQAWSLWCLRAAWKDSIAPH